MTLHIWSASCRCWDQLSTVDKDGFPLRFQLLVMACYSLRCPGENQSWQSKGFLLRLLWVSSRGIRTSLSVYLSKKIKYLIFLIKITSCLLPLLLPPKLNQISPGNLRKSRDFGYIDKTICGLPRAGIPALPPHTAVKV